jgi:DNA replication initiation complex subunit (GINS family)
MVPKSELVQDCQRVSRGHDGQLILKLLDSIIQERTEKLVTVAVEDFPAEQGAVKALINFRALLNREKESGVERRYKGGY